MSRTDVVAVVAMIVLPLFVTSQGPAPCSTSDLPAQPGSPVCRVDNHQTTSTEIRNGGTCTFRCTGSESTLSWRQCDDGKWRGGDRKCEGNDNTSALKKLSRLRRPMRDQRHRVKRFWWILIACWLFRCYTPRDSQSPTIQACPSDIHATADPFQTHTKVDWEEPTAYDDRDGKVRAVRHGLAPGLLFSEPYTTIRYTAQDRAGNMATCSFNIHVHVIRCTPAPPRVNNGYRICHLSTDYVLGSVCWYGCYEGHELTGASSTTIKCKRSGRWSANFPTCKKVECPELHVPQDMAMQCTDGFRFRSICTYSCTQPGYDIPPGKRRALVCQANKRWSGQRVGCKDMERPRFLPYPRVITAIADRGSDSTRVTFYQPDVTDNSPKTMLPIQVKGQQSESRFNVGVHQIEFHAVDGSGNEAKPLKIKIIVKELVCQALYRTPYQTVVCEQGYRYGSPCYFSCDDDFALVGTANVTCEKMGNPPYGAWTFGIRQPKCTVAKQCPALRAPANGAMVCDTWFGGQFCQLMCRNGTDIPRTFPFYRLFQCGNSGVWNIKEFDLAQRIPDCIKPRPGQKVKYRMTMTYYFNGDCRSNETLLQIKKAFLGELSNNIDCSLYPECSLENVKVICGKTTRRKRDTSDGGEMNLEVTFSYNLQTMNDQSEVMAWVSAMMDGVEKTTHNALTTDQGTELSFVSIDDDKLTVLCTSGHLPNYKTFKCDPCDKGSYHDVASNTCKMCPKGEYQEKEGQTSCLRCPSDHTTAGKGATHSHSCQKACEVGFVSRTGTTPCSPCELSTYQPQRGQNTCISCTGSMTTVSQGAVSDSECTEFDLDLEPSDTSIAQASLEIDDLELDDVFVVSWWLRTQVQDETRLLTISGDTSDDWLMVTVSDSSHIAVNSQEYITSHNITDGMWHFIRMDFTSTHCDVSVDGGDRISKPHTWTTGNKTVSKVILGGNSFSGSVSNFNIWSNSEMLPDTPTCRSDSSGDELSWRGFVYANLTETAFNFPSECDDFDNCISNPCFHGNCSDGLESYDCACHHGYEGDRCEINIDDCVDNVCENNGTCVDQVGGFTCDCSDLFTGELCEIAVVHGKWGEWEDWSTCSVSCGEGVRTRKRACTDPSPDNGGRECDGSDTEQQVCNDIVCPVCKEIPTPDNGSLSCENSTLINCTMECDEGFLPDIEPLSSYYCGEETGYIWNFETEQNPHRRLPFCSETHIANELTATYNIKYRDLRCGENEAATYIVKNVVRHVLQLDVTCVKDAKCNVDDVSVGCSELRREKRDVSEDNLGFTVTLRNNVVSPENAALLESAMRGLQDSAQVGSFTVNISGVLYYVDVNQTDVFGDVVCPAGMKSYSYFCVPCGKGSFLADGSCMRCGYGTYQDQTGQTVCEQCPDGWTTDSWGSREVTDCSVQRLADPGVTTSYILQIAVPVMLLVTAGVIIAVVVIKKLNRRKSVTRPNTPAQDLDDLPPVHTVTAPRHLFEMPDDRARPQWMAMNVNSLQYEEKLSLPPVTTHLD